MTAQELDAVKINWINWNARTCVMELLWYPMLGITMYLEYDFPLEYTGMSFLLILTSRAIMFYGFYEILLKEESNGRQRSIPDVAMIRTIEMVDLNKYFDFDFQYNFGLYLNL